VQKQPKPVPAPSPESQPYWRAARAHELRLPFCRPCQAFYFYPRRFCPRCFSWDIEWRPVSGRGRLYTFAIQYRAFHPGWAEDTPYVTAIVQLDEGPRIFTRLVDVDPDPKAVHCDMPVEVAFQDVSEEISLPVFRPLDGAKGPS
jgi:uncharacterized OB-fold protein